MRAVLAGPAGCLRSRWRSSPWKWRNDAIPRGRGQKALSTTRCIETSASAFLVAWSSSQKAPSTTRCIKTVPLMISFSISHVRKHPAPLGVLRLLSCDTLNPKGSSESTQHQKVH